MGKKERNAMTAWWIVLAIGLVLVGAVMFIVGTRAGA